MAIVKLRPGEAVLVAAVREGDIPDQGLPAPEQPVDPGYGIDIGLGTPEHPIVLPPDPETPLPPYPDIGGPGDQPYPDQGLPGEQPHPDQGLPGSQPRPDQGLPPFPSHPIVLPPVDQIPPPIDPGENSGWELVVAWTPVTGWIVVAVPKEDTLVPTPSKKKK